MYQLPDLALISPVKIVKKNFGEEKSRLNQGFSPDLSN